MIQESKILELEFMEELKEIISDKMDMIMEVKVAETFRKVEDFVFEDVDYLIEEGTTTFCLIAELNKKIISTIKKCKELIEKEMYLLENDKKIKILIKSYMEMGVNPTKLLRILYKELRLVNFLLNDYIHDRAEYLEDKFIAIINGGFEE